MIIAFTGRARHGKSTAADYLQDRYGFTQASFAQPLKEMCYSGLLKNPPPAGIEDDRFDAKWESDREFWRERLWTTRSPFSRWLLQFVGTEVMRAADPNYWARKAVANLDANIPYAFADLRFFNEAEAVRAVGGTIVRLVRIKEGCHEYIDPCTNPQHDSEAEMIQIRPDHIIWAPDVRTLHSKLDALMALNV